MKDKTCFCGFGVRGANKHQEACPFPAPDLTYRTYVNWLRAKLNKKGKF